MGQFVIGGDWLKYLGTLKKDGAWGDHIAVMALARHCHMTRIVSSAAGTDDCFDIIIEPHNQATFHDMPLLLGHYAENHYESLDIITNGINIIQAIH